MCATSPKKLLIVHILEILKKYTDEEHRLSQKQIVDILQSEYGMNADRKAVKRNLMDLIDCGYDIEYRESVRMVPNKKTGEPEESYLLSDFYLVRDFTDSQLRLLIDSLLFSRHVPRKQCMELIQKLEGLSNQYFKARARHITTMPNLSPDSGQFFYTIEILDEAISKNRQVAFTYNEYGTDKKLHPKLDRDGAPKTYIVNPYQMAAANGRYYLICNYDKYDNVANYRLDRITNIKMLDHPAKPAKQVRGLEKGFDLPKHMMEHPYMFTGESMLVTFRAKKQILNDVFDWFGGDASFFDERAEEVSVRVFVNYDAMRHWAMQYANHVTILAPERLRNQVKEELLEAAKNYAR